MNNKMKIIPVFVPHVGCPNDCVFCNQKRITGKGNVIANAKYVTDIVEEYILTIDKNTHVELAFFGGSFTAIDKGIQEELLGVAKKYKDLGIIHSIRCSTRPDAINEEILELQKKYSMDIIELGIQSLDNEVLSLSNRGHSKENSIYASKLIKEFNFTLGHQIMPGLPGSTYEKDMKTCQDSILMKPDIVRIYPTLVIKDTDLVTMYENKSFKPLSLDEAVIISAYMYSKYIINNIKVIRIGLQNTESINENEDVVVGPFHPAFRQLVEEKIYLTTLFLKLKNLNCKNITIHADNKLINNIAGHKKNNINLLKERLLIKNINFKPSYNENIIEIYNEQYKIDSFNKNEIFENYLNYTQGEKCI